MITAVRKRLQARSAALLLVLDCRLDRILQGWLLIAGLASAGRIAIAARAMPIASFSTLTSYTLLVVAPFASTLLALWWFRDGHLQAQPTTRLARFGRWTSLSRAEAEEHRLYGASGIMVSLLFGLMLTVPVRAAEYLAAVPPLPDGAPHWLSSLQFAMTFDAVLCGRLSMIAFVAALRHVPLFPRLLLLIWASDLTMQLVTARLVSDGGPPTAVALALQNLLVGNIKKVLISMALWLPYLLLSTRVNVTYRSRIPA
jgi:hypothetical protein